MVKKTEYKIYTERECKEEPYRKKVQLFGYVVGENAPVVLICPGGAYKFISDFNEGEPFAREFNKRGINAFVLFYSVGYNARYPRPVKDVARSMQFIKANAERLCVDGSNIWAKSSEDIGPRNFPTPFRHSNTATKSTTN
jgi:acetyl esterase/lipase